MVQWSLWTSLLVVSALNAALLIGAAPTTRFGPSIANAGGVALSADGRTAFVPTISTTSASVYVIPLPFNSSSNAAPSPYWTTSANVQYYYVAASTSASPQLVYLLDNQNAQLVSLAITSPRANATVLVYSFGIANQYLIDSMFHQASTDFLFFSCYDHFGGAQYDFIAWLDPSAASPSLQTLYTTSISADIAGLAVSSTHLYFGTVTSYTATDVARIWAVPLNSPRSLAPIANTTRPQLLYSTANSNLNMLEMGDLVYPAAFVLNAAESILYLTDIGNANVQAASSPHAVYALWPLYATTTPLNLTGLFEYEGQTTEIMQCLALSPDQSTLYWAGIGGRSGLYFTFNANSSITLPPISSPASSSSVAPPAVVTSMSQASSPSSQVSLPPSSPSSAVPFGPALSTSTWTSTSVSPTVMTTSASAVSMLPVGSIAVVTTVIFSDRGDALACLSADSTVTRGFAASDGGDIYAWNLTAQPSTVSPVYIAGTGSTGSSFIACQANPAGTVLYLVDTRGVLLYSYTIATPSVAPVIISRFPNEFIGSLVGLAIDFASSIAYIGTRSTDNLYAVNISVTGQSSLAFDAYAVNSDITALTLSADAQDVILRKSFTPAQGAQGTINALQVRAGYVPYPASPTLLYGSTSLIYPDCLLLNGSTVYVKDGGALHGEDGPSGNTPEELYSFTLGSTAAHTALTTLYRTTTSNLPPGLVMAADYSRLFYATSSTINSVLVVAQPAPPQSSSSSPRPLSSSARSSVTSSPSAGGSSSALPSSIVSSYTSSAVTSAALRGSSPSVPSSAASSSLSSSGGSGIDVGGVSVVSVFAFTQVEDAMACLSSDSTATRWLGASDGGDLFVWSLHSPSQPPVSVTPSYVFGAGNGLAAAFIACQANPAGTVLYLLDTRGKRLYAYNTTTPSAPPSVVAAFPDEVVGSLTALTIDFASSIAYIGTRSTDVIYAVNVSATGQSVSSFSAYAVNSDVTAMAVSADGATLYYASPSPVVDVKATINSLAVQAGVIADSSNPTLLYSSTSLIYPDSLLVVGGSTLYVKDGGPMHAEEEEPGYMQDLFMLTLGSPSLNSSLTALLQTTTQNLPSGLVLSNDRTTLYFVTSSSLNSLRLAPPPVSPSSTQQPPPSPQSSSSTRGFSSSTVAAPVSSSAAPATSAPLTSIPLASMSSSAATVFSSAPHTTSPLLPSSSSAVSTPSASITSPPLNSQSTAAVTAVISSTNSPQPSSSTATSLSSPSAVPTPEQSSSMTELSGGVIAGIVVGAVLAPFLVCLLCWFCMRHWIADQRDKTHDSEGWGTTHTTQSDVELQSV